MPGEMKAGEKKIMSRKEFDNPGAIEYRGRKERDEMIIFYIICPKTPIPWWLYWLGMAEVLAELYLPCIWSTWRTNRQIRRAGQAARERKAQASNRA